MADDMLKSYSLNFSGKNNGKKDYELTFKVANGVGVTFEEDNGINKIQLRWDGGSGGNKGRKYEVAGPLKVQFFQHPRVGAAGKDGPDPDPGPVGPDPDLSVEP